MAYERKKYEQGQKVTDAQAALDAHAGTKPGAYESQHKAEIDALRQQIMTRPSFNFNPDKSAIFNRLKGDFMQQGKLAMQDTIAQSTALTGGYGNSWAHSAGQQAYQGQMGKLNEMLPQIYGMEADQYAREGDDLATRYGMLTQLEDQDYGRYQHLVDRWNQENAALKQDLWHEREFDYGRYQDDEAAAHQLDREAKEDAWREKEWQENMRRYEESKRSRGGGGGGDKDGDSPTAWANLSLQDLEKAMSQAKSRKEAQDLADEMWLAGVDEDLTHRLYEKYFERGGGDKNTGAARKPNKNRDMTNLY